MKNLHNVTDKSAYPQFWDEEWLKKAIAEVDTRNMTAEQKLSFEMAISANALAVKNENRKLREAREAENLAVKISTINKMLLRGKATIEEIAEDFNVSIEFVTEIQKKVSFN